jgi:hypothetical protein
MTLQTIIDVNDQIYIPSNDKTFQHRDNNSNNKGKTRIIQPPSYITSLHVSPILPAKLSCWNNTNNNNNNNNNSNEWNVQTQPLSRRFDDKYPHILFDNFNISNYLPAWIINEVGNREGNINIDENNHLKQQLQAMTKQKTILEEEVKKLTETMIKLEHNMGSKVKELTENFSNLEQSYKVLEDELEDTIYEVERTTSSRKKRPTCAVCYESFEYFTDLLMHLNNVGHHCCITCTHSTGKNQLFSSERDLSNHLKTSHQNNDIMYRSNGKQKYNKKKSFL